MAYIDRNMLAFLRLLDMLELIKFVIAGLEYLVALFYTISRHYRYSCSEILINFI
jgi:hypothetical protein